MTDMVKDGNEILSDGTLDSFLISETLNSEKCHDSQRAQAKILSGS